MSIEKTYTFLIRFSVILTIFLGISLFVHSLIGFEPNKRPEGIPFLLVSEKSVDSVISTLSTDEKIEMVFCSDNQYTMVIPKVGSKLIDSVSISDTGYLAMNNYQDKPIKIQPFNFQDINEPHVFNAVIDTSFLMDYLLFRSVSVDSATHCLLNLTISSEDVQNLNDSAFSGFYINRLEHFKNRLRDNYRLFGLKIGSDDLKKIASSSSNPYLEKFSTVLNSDLDLLCVDSVKYLAQMQYGFEGLLLAKIKGTWLSNETEFIKLFQSSPNIFISDTIETKLFRSKAKGLFTAKKISEQELNNKIRKSIKAKLWMERGCKLKLCSEIQPHTLYFYNNLLSQHSIALLNNPDSLLPIKYIHTRKFTIVWIGNSVNQDFQKNCNYYVQTNSVLLVPGKKDWKQKLGIVNKQNLYIYVLDTLLTGSDDIKQFEALKNSMDSKNSVILNFDNYKNLEISLSNIAVIQVQSRASANYCYSAQAIFGGIAIQGQLPCKISGYTFGLGKKSPKTRLKYSIPEEVGINADKLNEIDNIVNAAISGGAFPGCQVFVAKNGQVIYDKSFGYHTYAHDNAVSRNDIYDLASVTKIAATTIAAMKMISDRKMSLNDVLGKFFRDTKIDYTRIKPDTLINIDTFYNATIHDWKKFLKGRDTLNINDSSFVTLDTVIYKLTPKLNIFKVPIIDLLKHQSGINPALPIFRYMYYKAYYIKKMKEQLTALHGRTGPLYNYKTFELPIAFPDNTELEDSLKSFINKGFRSQYNEYFSAKYAKDSSDIRLTDNLFLKNKYFDTIWRDTKQLPVYGRKVFIYSDINMILLQLAIDSLNKQDIDTYMKKTIYNPLGLKNTSFLPLKYYSKSQIVPTEMEKQFRFGYLHGYVHDPSSALLGGMAGNAGLYSCAHELGVLFQMVLNKGSYGGIKYINPSVIDQFITRYEDIQRGLGFDMPNRKAKVGSKAPMSTFGHSGYTGTCVWVDPENELVYVFLANRNNPNASNWRINSMNVRERVHNAIYNAISDKKKEVTNKESLNL